MPIRRTIEIRHDLRICVYRYAGHIDVADVFDFVVRTASQLPQGQPYSELLIFEHDTDLSDFNQNSLQGLVLQCRQLNGQLKLGARTAAAVVDNSVDAKIIMKLFNALSLIGNADLGFKLFAKIKPALKWLHIPEDEGLKIIARTAQAVP